MNTIVECLGITEFLELGTEKSFQKLSLSSVIRSKGGDEPTQLSLLGGADFIHWTKKVHDIWLLVGISTDSQSSETRWY
jgi:hypothetical protein